MRTWMPKLGLALALPAAVVLAAAAARSDPQPTAQVTKAPWVIWPTQAGVTVMFEADENAAITVSYSTDLNYGQSVPAQLRETIVGPPDRYLYAAELTGLAAGTLYNYRVNYDTNPAATFSTLPATATSFSFIAYGDSRSNPGPHRGVTEHFFTGRSPSFILHVGDFTDTNDYSLWAAQYFTPLAGIVDRIPLWPARGNHEGEPATAMRRVFDFDAHTANNYYSYDYGNTHVTVLDTRWTSGDPDYAPMLAWCAADLAAASAATWKVVMYHKPSYDATYHDAEPWGREDFVPLFHQYQVDVAFTGHAHLYERFVPMTSNAFPNNPPVTYFVTGGGGAPLSAAVAHNFLAYTESTYEYMAVTVNGPTISMSIRNQLDSEIDSVTWTKTAGVPNPEYLALARPIQGFDAPELADAGAAWRSFSPGVVRAGDAFSAGCRVKNAGAFATGVAFAVRFYASTDQTITAADYLLGESTVAALAAGASADCTWSGSFPAGIPGGTYYVGWIIDAAGVVAEGDETNNTACKDNAVLVVDPGTVTCTLGPAGAVAAGAEWRLTAGPDTAWQASGAGIADVPVGTYTLTFKDVAGWATPGDQLINVTAGADVSATGTYGDHAPPEAIPEVTPGTSGTTATVFHFQSSLSHAHDGCSLASRKWEIVEEGGVASTDLTFDRVFTSAGSYHVKLTVTDDAAPALSDEDTLVIQVDPLPDLVVQSVTHLPASPKVGQTVTFTVVVRNGGEARADGDFNVGFWSNRATPPLIATAPELNADIVGGLDPGETKILEFDVTATAQGSFKAWVYLDRADAVAESDEANNAGPAGGHAWNVGKKSGGGGGGGGGGCSLAAEPTGTLGALGWGLPYLAVALAWLRATRSVCRKARHADLQSLSPKMETFPVRRPWCGTGH